MPKVYLDDVCASLASQGLASPVLRDAVAALYDDIVQRLDERAPIHGTQDPDALMVPGTRWVIHNSDINLLQNLLAGFVAYSATGLLTGDDTAKDLSQGAAGALAVFVTIFQAARRKRARLTKTQFLVLATLRRYSTANVSDLAARVSLQTGVEWSEEQVTTELTSLNEVRLADGSVTAFASKTPDGIWGAVDV